MERKHAYEINYLKIFGHDILIGQLISDKTFN